MAESPREKMPDRRETETFSFEHEDLSYIASLGRFSDGRLSELFISGGIVGSSVRIMTQELSVLLSISLQHGVPLKTLRDGLPKLNNGKFAGPLGNAIRIAEEKEKAKDAIPQS